MKTLKLLLIPFSLLYGIITWIRNICFDFGILPSKSFNIPIISVGNLRAGGTGKTPHIEYLIKLLTPKHKTAVLSRGYGRKTSGFILADENTKSKEIGDEPMQIFKKFKSVSVAVHANRVKGIKNLLNIKPEIKAILLDDAFQHRYVNPGLSILLTEYSDLYSNDFMLPTGNLREFAGGASRADIIIVTKTPNIFSPLDRRSILDKINPKPYQRVYFSYTKYGDLVPLNKPEEENPFTKEYYFERNYSFLVLTGIAKAINIQYYLKSKVSEVIPMAFADHHQYTSDDINELHKTFNSIASSKKIIITTEKDSMRLLDPEISALLADLPIFYLPLEVIFHGNDEINFNNHILDHVR